MAQPKGKPSNNKKKETWYPVLSKDKMKLALEHEGLLECFDVYHLDKRTIEFFKEDICAFINRACRAVYLSKNNLPSLPKV
jgi:hypothetical protein